MVCAGRSSWGKSWSSGEVTPGVGRTLSSISSIAKVKAAIVRKCDGRDGFA